MKISVIIPVYNGEKYLKNCLDSILNQTIGKKHLEIIIINDGSTDNSEKIIKNYKNDNQMITYINQQNQGQAAARNRALSLATGDYISFVDCDDTIELDMYEKLLNIAISNNYDIVTCDYNIYNDNNKEIFKFRFVNDENKNFIIMNTGPCNMIIKRNFLLNLEFKFPDGIIYEDFAVIPPLGINANIYHLEEPLYNYYKRKDSTMNNKKYNAKLNDIFIAFQILKEKLEDFYHEECEFLFIKNIMMSASLRFVSFKDPENKIKYISNYAHKHYAKWKKNKYFRMLNFKKKIVAYLTYYRCSKLLYILNKLNRRIK